MARLLPILIVVFAALDGFVHFDLAFLGPRAFSFNTFSDLFVLNVIGYVALIVAFLATQRSTISTRRIVTTVVAIYPIVTLAACV